jgi:hypothetical protein
MSQFGYLGEVAVNADDFGMSFSVNKAILLAFKQGLISSTSIMANMPGFEDACDLAHRHKLEERVGIHVNLTECRPLTGRISRCPRFCGSDGRFNSIRYRLLFLSKAEVLAVEEELEAQVQACLEQRIRPAHLDSHHHYHTEWEIGSIAIRVAKRNRIPAIRLSNNCRVGISVLNRLYKLAYNLRLRRHGLAKVGYCGLVVDARGYPGIAGKSIEIIVHPRLTSSGLLIDLDGEDLRSLIASLNLRESKTSAMTTAVS